MTDEKRPHLHDDAASDLCYWLGCETWSAKEALCLLSCIDPRLSQVDWSGYKNQLGVNILLPSVDVLVLLDQNWIPRNFSDDDAANREMYKRAWQHPAHSEHGKKAAKLLQDNWDIFDRDPTTEIEEQRQPTWFIDWAQEKGINIPWLPWAMERNLVNESATEKSADNVTLKRAADADIRRKEGRRAAITILNQEYTNGRLNSEQDFEGCMTKAHVIQFIRRHPKDYPQCNKTKSYADDIDRTTIKQREPLLTKIFRKFTDDPDILSEYKRLTGER